MVHSTTSNGQQFKSYELQMLTARLNTVLDRSAVERKTSNLKHKLNWSSERSEHQLVGNWLSFSTHTHTPESNNHSKGYGHPKTAVMQKVGKKVGRIGFEKMVSEHWQEI
jgi:hypothetical protein